MPVVADNGVLAQPVLEKAFLENRPKLHGFLLSLGAADAADDILQDVWLRLQRLPAGTVEQPLPYLFRMAHHFHLDRRRGLNRSAVREQVWGTTQDDSVLPHDRALIAREELRAVDDALTALGEPTATIFRRHRVSGVAQRAIADDLGVGLSTVERHLRRAYAALADLRSRRDEV